MDAERQALIWHAKAMIQIVMASRETRTLMDDEPVWKTEVKVGLWAVFD